MLLPGDKVAVTRDDEEFTDVISQMVIYDDNKPSYYFMEHDDGADPEQCKLIKKGTHDGKMPEAKYAIGDYILFVYDLDKKEYVRKITEVAKYLDIDKPPCVRYTIECENLDWADDTDVKGKMVLV